MKEIVQVLFAILRSAVTGQEMSVEEKALCDGTRLPLLFSLAKKHDLAHLVAEGLDKNGLLDKQTEEGKGFLQSRLKAVYRYEQLEYEYGEMCEILQKEGIAFIPLKGSIIRGYYPQPWMRTSCDVDILIHEENLEQAVEAFKENGYEYKGREYHDVSLFSPAGIHLELHFSLLENQENLDGVLGRAWNFAEAKEGTRYAFTKEFFLFHIFAHAAYHFLSGGCGLRTLPDIWVLKYKMESDYVGAQNLLEEAGIYTFAKELDALCEYCFSGVEGTSLTPSLLEYIVGGGVYGTIENKVTMQKGKGGSSFGYLWRRFFPSYRVMKEYYRVLEKAPILLPFCWVARWFKTLFRGNGGRAVREIKTASKLSKENGEALQDLREGLGL